MLPFAQQTSIGFVIHRDHPAAIEWDAMMGGSGPGVPKSLGVTISDAAEWSERLVLHTDAGNGTVYWVDGFVFFEILFEALARRGPVPLAALARHHTSVRPEEQRLLFCAHGSRTDRHESSVFVFDPGEFEVVSRLLAPEFRIIVVPHEVDIPVGVGFTLPCLPKLVISGRWEAILREAERLYSPHAETLERLGIRLSASLI